jgi:hypothetical protein
MISYRYSESNLPAERGLNAIDHSKTISFRVSAKYSPLEGLFLASRFDCKRFSGPLSTGYAVYQDVHYTFKRIPVDIWWRYSIFETDSWDTRIYHYENDLLYTFSIPAFSGSGTRSYIMIGFKTGRFMSVRLKAGTTISKSNNGYSHTDELKAQIKLEF